MFPHITLTRRNICSSLAYTSHFSDMSTSLAGPGTFHLRTGKQIKPAVQACGHCFLLLHSYQRAAQIKTTLFIPILARQLHSAHQFPAWHSPALETIKCRPRNLHQHTCTQQPTCRNHSSSFAVNRTLRSVALPETVNRRSLSVVVIVAVV